MTPSYPDSLTWTPLTASPDVEAHCEKQQYEDYGNKHTWMSKVFGRQRAHPLGVPVHLPMKQAHLMSHDIHTAMKTQMMIRNKLLKVANNLNKLSQIVT